MKRTKNDKKYDLDFDRKVFVYKNLHKGCWSIKQDGLVKAHATELTLYGCNMYVNRKGRQRVLKERSKNVHAFVRGILVDDKTMRDHYGWLKPMPRSVSYNPYKSASFRDAITGEVVRKSDWASLIKREDTPPKIWSY